MFDFMIFVHLSFFCSDKNRVTIVFKSVGVVSNVRHEICFQDVTLNPNQMFFKWIILWIREKYTNQILKHFHIIFDIHLPRLFCFGFGPTSVCINFHFFVLSRWVKKRSSISERKMCSLALIEVMIALWKDRNSERIHTSNIWNVKMTYSSDAPTHLHTNQAAREKKRKLNERLKINRLFIRRRAPQRVLNFKVQVKLNTFTPQRAHVHTPCNIPSVRQTSFAPEIIAHSARVQCKECVSNANICSYTIASGSFYVVALFLSAFCHWCAGCVCVSQSVIGISCGNHDWYRYEYYLWCGNAIYCWTLCESSSAAHVFSVCIVTQRHHFLLMGPQPWDFSSCIPNTPCQCTHTKYHHTTHCTVILLIWQSISRKLPLLFYIFVIPMRLVCCSHLFFSLILFYLCMYILHVHCATGQPLRFSFIGSAYRSGAI